MFTTPMLFQTIYIYIYIYIFGETNTHIQGRGKWEKYCSMQEPVHSLRGKVDGQTY